MQVLGRALQLFGIVVVPMALIYYFSQVGQKGESELMFGELAILMLGAGCFWIGNTILGRGSARA